MAEQSDDRISSFINEQGINDDKKIIIDALNEIKTSMKDLNKIRIDLFGTNTISQAITAISAINKSVEQTNKLKKQAIEIMQKEAQLQLTNLKIQQAGIDSQVKAEKELERQRKLNEPKPVKEPKAPKPEKELTEFEQLKVAAKEAKKEYDNLLHTLGRGSQTADVARLKWKNLEAQVREVGIAGKNVFAGTTAKGKNTRIAELKRDISELERLAKGATHKLANLTAVKGSGRNENAIKSTAQQLGRYNAELKLAQQEVSKLDAAEKLRINSQKESSSIEAKINKELAAGKQLNGFYDELIAKIKELQVEAQEIASKGILGNALSDAEKKRLAEINVKVTELSNSLAKANNQMGKGAKDQYAYAAQLFSLQQIIREMPNAAFGWNILLAALSNNIPIFTDDIQRLIKRNKELAEAGKEQIPVLTTVWKAFRSWTTVIGIGVALLTVFGPKVIKWIENMWRGAAATRAAYLASKEYAELQKILAKAINNVSDAITNLIELQKRANVDGLRGLRSQLSVYEAMGLSADKLFATKNKINALELNTAQKAVNTTAALASDFVAEQDGAKIKKNDEDRDRLNAEKDKALKRLRSAQFDLSKEQQKGVSPASIEKRKQEVEEAKRELESVNKSIGITQEIERNLTNRILINGQYVKDKKKLNEDLTLSEKERFDKQQLLDIEFQKQIRDNINEENEKRQRAKIKLQSQIQSQGDRVNKANEDPLKDKSLQALIRLSEALDTEIETAKNQATLLESVISGSADAITKTKQDAAEQSKYFSDQELEKRLSNAKKAADETIRINDEILNNDRRTFEEKIAAVQKIKDAEIKLAQAERDNILGNSGVTIADKVTAPNEFATAKADAELKATLKLIELNDEHLERFLSATRSSYEAQLNMSNTYNEKINAGTAASLKQRTDALQKWYENKSALLERSLDDELKVAGLTDKEIESLKKGGPIIVAESKKTINELLAIRNNYNASVEMLNIEMVEKSGEVINNELLRNKELFERASGELGLTFSDLLINTNKGVQEEMEALREQYKSGIIGASEYSRKIADIFRKAELDRIKLERSNIEAQLKDLNPDKVRKEFEDSEGGLKTAKDNLADLQKLPKNDTNDKLVADGVREVELAQTRYDLALEFYTKLQGLLTSLNENIATETATIAKNETEVLEEKIELWGRVFDTINKASQAGQSILEAAFQRRLEMIDEEISALDKRSAKEKEIIDQTITNEEEKAKRLRELEIKTENQRIVLEQRRKKEERDRAIMQKAMALFNIIAQTTQAITEINLRAAVLNATPATAPFGARALAQIPFVIAQSALSMASIAAQPLPKLAKGSDDFEGGLAVLGDGGRSELVLQPDGTMFVTGSTPEIHDLPKHSMVFPDANAAINSARMMTDNVIGMSVAPDFEVPGMNKLDDTMRNGFSQLSKTIKNKPEIVLRRGINKDLLLRYGSDYWKYIN